MAPTTVDSLELVKCDQSKHSASLSMAYDKRRSIANVMYRETQLGLEAAEMMRLVSHWFAAGWHRPALLSLASSPAIARYSFERPQTARGISFSAHHSSRSPEPLLGTSAVSPITIASSER